MAGRPRFLVLEGVDGSGKSTQARRLVQRLETLGRKVRHLREPGSTRVGERVREILLDPTLGEIAPVTEVLLYQAARAELVAEVLRPALDQGLDVVLERWHYATSAYQGVAGGAGLEIVRATSAVAVQGLEPDRAVLLDLPDERAAARLGRALDRIELRGDRYRARVAQAYRAIFADDPDRLRVVEADADPSEVERRVWDAVRDLF